MSTQDAEMLLGAITAKAKHDRAVLALLERCAVALEQLAPRAVTAEDLERLTSTIIGEQLRVLERGGPIDPAVFLTTFGREIVSKLLYQNVAALRSDG